VSFFEGKIDIFEGEFECFFLMGNGHFGEKFEFFERKIVDFD
jgi:hypothetical protein